MELQEHPNKVLCLGMNHRKIDEVEEQEKLKAQQLEMRKDLLLLTCELEKELNKKTKNNSRKAA